MSRAAILCILAMSLTLTACKKDDPKPTPDTDKTEEVKKEETKKEEVKKEEPKEEPKEEAKKEEAPKIDEGMFISAFYEVTCVQSKITDAEKQKEIIAEILPRYGFDQAAFDAAKAKLGSAANVELALKSKMEGCKDASVAEGFKTAGAGAAAEKTEGEGEEKKEGEEKTEEKKVKKPAAPKFVSSASARGLKVGDLNQGSIQLRFSKKFAVTGKFSGKREGKFFNIPLIGKVEKNGNFRAAGKQGSNNVTVNGRATKTGATGQIKGSINKKGFSLRFSGK